MVFSGNKEDFYPPGQPVQNSKWISEFLDGIHLSKQLAIIKRPGHSKANMKEAKVMMK
jgi:hypothetical protein